MKKIGIFGGTFDPVHLGHLTVAGEFARSLDLETVYLIPAAVPPHRPDPPVASSQDRLEMLSLAAAGNPVLKVSELELQREGMSYTLDTIRDLREDIGEGEFFMALGADAYSEISTWHRPDEVMAAVNIVVLTRPGFEIDLIGSLPEKIISRYAPVKDGFRHSSGTRLFSLSVSAVDISASGIKKLISEGKSFHELVPDNVYDYIVRKDLYR